MENRKKYGMIVIIIIALICIGIMLMKNEKPNNITSSNHITPEENKNELEKVNVSGFHLVTYEQSANNNSFINTLNVDSVSDGNIKFVIGTIDENFVVQERMSFEIACKKGENTIDLRNQRYFIKTGEYLFMDIYGQDVLYTQEGETAKSLVQNEANKVAGKMIMVKSDFILPFQYTLEKTQEYNVLVIGNDITTKDGGKGIAATDETKDYYTLTKARLEKNFQKVNINRINALDWEQNKLLTTRKDWITQNLKKDTISNLDLIIFQLGDNYYQEDDFETSVTELVEEIRNSSPNAEMVWIGVWEINEKILNRLPGICERLEIEFINISDLAITDYQSLVTTNTDSTNLAQVFYPNNEAMQIISNRIIETLKFEF